VYQSLPDEWVNWVDEIVPFLNLKRNDELLYTHKGVGFNFVLTLAFGGLWGLFFFMGEKWSTYVATVMITGMLVTAVLLMMAALKYQTNWIEWISMRVGWSMYAGWLTAATILMVTSSLQTFGNGTYNAALFGLTEEAVTIFVLWAAFLIYGLASYTQRNPVYGFVFLWAVIAIWWNVQVEFPQYTILSKQTIILAILQGISMVGLTTWLGTAAYYDVTSI